MISYKRDVLERQSLSEVKMGRGSPICERVRKKIVKLELGGMTKNVYHGIFLNYTGFTVYDGIFFFPWMTGVLTTFSTD